VPLDAALSHLLVTVGGHTISVPLVADCVEDSYGPDCFQADRLGGPWTSGTPYSVSLRP
jgi:hypothetical protein